MPVFSEHSKKLLSEAHPVLQQLMNLVIEYKDIKIVAGKRSVQQQRLNVQKGVSKTMNSRHISRKGEDFCRAVDVQPYPRPKNGRDLREELTLLAGMVYGLAIAQGIEVSRSGLRWGGDWNCNLKVEDNSFDDLFHFEYNG